MTEPTDQKQPETESKSARSSGAGIAVLIGLLVLGGLGLLGSKALKPAATTLATPRSATDAEQQENLEGTLKFNATRSIMGQADLEAWQAAKAATGATTFDKKYDAWRKCANRPCSTRTNQALPSQDNVNLIPDNNVHTTTEPRTSSANGKNSIFEETTGSHCRATTGRRSTSRFALRTQAANISRAPRIAQPSEIMSCAWSLVAISSGRPLVEANVNSYDFAKSQYETMTLILFIRFAKNITPM